MFEKDLRKLVDQNWRAHKSRRELTWNNLATSHEGWNLPKVGENSQYYDFHSRKGF